MLKDHLISIVGAGPGDPDLLTVKALRRIQSADVILYDALHGDEVLQLASERAVKIYAGKHYQDGQHQTERQDKIHEQLKQYAMKGLHVVRLKAGDPFIFGRGAEELEFCLSENLNVEVVPGITAGLAAATTFHIPVTLRGENSMALFYTGHKRNGGFDDIDTVASVLKSKAPVIVYMGLKNLQLLASALIDLGVKSGTPVQIASRVGHLDQQNFSTFLDELDDFLAKNEPPMPSVILIGTHARPILPAKY